MSVGANPGKADIDGAACNLIVALKQIFADMNDLQTFLLRTGPAALAGQFGYTPTEVADLMSGYSDLVTFTQIFRGKAAQAGAQPYDYLTFGGLLTGIN